MAKVTRVTVTIDKNAAKEVVDEVIKERIPIVTKQLVEYGNEFVREQTGKLKESAYKESDYDKGLAVWGNSEVYYAEEVYFYGTPRTNVNPKASLEWAQKAVDVYGDELTKLFQEGFENRGL